MKRWLRNLVWLVEATFLLVVIYFEPTHDVRGVLWREAFFNGKPTSWWRTELELWDFEATAPRGPRMWHWRDAIVHDYRWSRQSTSWERFQKRWWPRSKEEMVLTNLQEALYGLRGPELLTGGEN